MATVCFPSLPDGDIVEAQFLRLDGGLVPLTLLVDSGFTGQSSFVLPRDAVDLAHAMAPASYSAGALHGLQDRVLVTCTIPALAFQRTLIAILTDLEPLSLPAGAQGLAGLRFLRQFRRWGAEQDGSGSWQFCLSGETG